MTTLLDLVPFDDPILRKKLEPFEFGKMNVKIFAKAMFDTMQAYRGIGLSACQVGVDARIFVLDAYPRPLVAINPRLVDISEETSVLDEACLSFPGLVVPVKRSNEVRLRYQQEDGETFTDRFTGMTARACLHEMDHLDGILFFDRADRYHRDRAIKNWKIFKRNQKRLKEGATQ